MLMTQHATNPLVLTPQTLYVPARTGAKEPPAGLEWLSPSVPRHYGGVLAPKLMCPQHSIKPSVLTPQVWLQPALTEAKGATGGVARPVASEPPAFHPAVGLHSAGVVRACADGNKGAAEGTGLAKNVATSVLVESPGMRSIRFRDSSPVRRNDIGYGVILFLSGMQVSIHPCTSA